MNFKLSFNAESFPGSLIAAAKQLSLVRTAETLRRARERLFLRTIQMQYRYGRETMSRQFLAGDVPRYSFCSSPYPMLPPLPWRLELDAEEHEHLLQGNLTVLGYEWNWSPDRLTWHSAPDTGRTWPRAFFAEIPIREGNDYGDVRVAWEASRLQHLVALALLAQKAEPLVRERAVAVCEAQLLSWVEGNPFLTGIHYISPMECALRLLAVCYATDLIRPWLKAPEDVWRAVLTVVHSHAELIRKRLPSHTSTPHEAVSEAAALLYAGSLFPEMEPAERWLALGLYLLEQETPRHISHDGGSIEQGFGYLQFSMDLYGLVVALLDHKQHVLPDKIRQAFDRSRTFLEEFRNSADGVLPRIGDGDNGSALSPFLRFPSNTKKRGVGLTTFHLSGYSIIRGQDLQHAIFDHGPLGMPPHYAHGHADALSLNLHVGSQEVLIDPGTFTYTGDPRWRRYFRGTRAHNTVVVDGLDQAVQEGTFRWSHPFHTHLIYKEESPEGKITVIARHYGYKNRLGVTHLRGVVYEPPGSWMIWDWLTGSGVHHLELNWHLSCAPTLETGTYQLPGFDRPLSLSVEGGSLSLHRGEMAPISGWWSKRYGTKEATTTLRVEHSGPLPHEFMTRLRIG